MKNIKRNKTKSKNEQKRGQIYLLRTRPVSHSRFLHFQISGEHHKNVTHIGLFKFHYGEMSVTGDISSLLRRTFTPSRSPRTMYFFQVAPENRPQLEM